MRKVKVRVGGKSRGRLVYWGYEVSGDKFNSDGYGFKFLSRKDKLKVIHYLHGLRSALIDFFENKVKAENTIPQYLVKYYCVDSNVFKILSKWGFGFRDPLIIEVTNSIKNLVNKIGLLDLVTPKKKDEEKKLERRAAGYFYRYVKSILEDSYVWQFSERPGYIVCRVPEKSKEIPLEFLARRIIEKEKKNGEVRGVVVLREDGSVTRILFYDLYGSKSIVDAFRRKDRLRKSEWIGTFKTFYVTESTAEKVEEILAEVAEHAQIH